jgi:hypothetical protein
MVRIILIICFLAFGAKLAFAVADFAKAREAARVYVMQQKGAE